VHHEAPAFWTPALHVGRLPCMIYRSMNFCTHRCVRLPISSCFTSITVPLSHSKRISYNPCLSQSPNFALPSCARLFMPCSLRSMFFNCVTSCCGALLTLCTMMVGSVSRIIPSSTISSTAKESKSKFSCSVRRSRVCLFPLDQSPNFRATIMLRTRSMVEDVLEQ
jgi:hypothetical protein